MSRILVVNPGSTSTKIGLYNDAEVLAQETLRYTADDLAPFSTIVDQLPFRLQSVEAFLDANETPLNSIDGFIAIGGMLRPGRAGVYAVNADVADDLVSGRYGPHASNLGGLLVGALAGRVGKTGYVADPVTADEIAPVARLSGHPKFPRKGRAHTLNQRAVAMQAARDMARTYEACRFIVAHMGGGVSVAAHLNGVMVETNNARGEGPFSANRSGGLNSWELAKYCLAHADEPQSVLAMISGKGGMAAYLGTESLMEIEQRMADGDANCKAVFDSFVYQIAKEIGSMSVVLMGDVDAVLLTGGMAFSERLTAALGQWIAHIAPVRVYPGELEMEALAAYMARVLDGTCALQTYAREE